MTELQPVEALGIFVVAAALTVSLTRWLKMPSIVSYILAGLLVGPVLGVVRPAVGEQGALEITGELGIILLMFLVGLELSLDRILQVGRVAVAAGLGQVLFTAAGGFLLCLALGFDATARAIARAHGAILGGDRDAAGPLG